MPSSRYRLLNIDAHMPRKSLHADWSEQEIAHLKRLVAKGYALTRISRRLGRANETVVKVAAENGINLPRRSTGRAAHDDHQD